MRTKIFLSVAVLITFLSGAFLVPNSFADSKERDEIVKFIKQKKARWSARDTKISRFTNAERKKRLGSQIPTQTIQEKNLVITSAAVPGQLDWRSYNGNSYVTPVKEQGDCSDCWAFASTAALESNKLIANSTPGVFIDLSEQTLNSCSGAGNCSGGYIDIAANYLRDIGLPIESCNPYTATDGMCSVSCSDWLTNPYKISGWYKVNPTVEAIKYALYNYGPVVALMSVYTDFYYYSAGVYEKSWGSFEGYHATTIIGYDDAEQFFIIKSSWGEDWGEAGYSKIAYSEVAGDTQFGFWTIAYESAIPTGFPTLDNIPRDPNNPNTGSQNGNGNEQLSVLNGTVKDESGNPVSGAEIKVGTYKTISNTAGVYVFSSLPAASYVATISKSGYSTLSESLTITPSDTITKDFVIFSSANDNTLPSAIDDNSQNKKDDKKKSKGERFYGPGWIQSKGEAITPQQAEEYLKARTEKMAAKKSTYAAPLAGVASNYNTDEIQALARALRNDPKLIYEYVHNNIDYVPYYGSLKGATLTYLDGSGNDFDQASLMIALLRASGYTAQYVYGQMSFSIAELANWLSTDSDATIVDKVLQAGYIPHNPPAGGNVIMDRVWVQATINGSNYLFDPAFKGYNYKATIDLGTAMGYNQSDLITAAKTDATFNDDYVQNLNETAIQGKLKNYTAQLINYIKNNYPSTSNPVLPYVEDIAGGRSIVATLTSYQTSLPNIQGITSGWPKTDIPDGLRTTLEISIMYFQFWEIFGTWFTDELNGKSITAAVPVYNPLTCGWTPTLRVGDTVYTTTSCNKFPRTLHLKITHPYADHSTQEVTHTLNLGGVYAIVYNFGGAISDKLLKKEQKNLELYRAENAPDTSEKVIRTALNVIGKSYLKQDAMANKMLSSLSQRILIGHHNVGVVAQDSLGCYVDVRAQVYATILKFSSDNQWLTAGSINALFLSAFEHGVLEQLTGTNVPAISTVKLLQIANNTSGKKVYLLKHSNYINIDSFINYGANLSDIKSELINDTNGKIKYIIPNDGQLGLSDYKFKGYAYIRESLEDENGDGQDDKAEFGMLILGAYGAYFGNPIDGNPAYVSNTSIDLIDLDTEQNIKTIQKKWGLDPVNMADGSLNHDKTALSLGGEIPLGLKFAHSYNSNKNQFKQTMGYGFNHNYNIYYDLISHAEPVLGGRQPIDAASTLVAMYTCIELMKTENIVNWMVSALTTKWAIDQMKNNAVTVNIANNITEFIKLPNNTYVSPPGMTTQLLNNSGTYTLKERNGTTMVFNSDKKIYQIKDADNNTATFDYYSDTKNLKTVTDAFGRTLTFNYTDGKISSVVDSASPARTVYYEYVNNELKKYRDAEYKLWSYGYDADGNHRMTTLTNPLSVTTATNVYDALGRVKTQTAPRQGGGMATYNFYFSGYRNQEEDPNGKATTYYYDQKGRSYAQEDALGNKTTQTYDGQDHVIKTIDPLGNETKYEYDGNNNLVKITNALSQSIRKTYDSQYYRLTDVKDDFDHITHYNYDSIHRYLVSDVTDAENNISVNTYYANGFKKTVKDPRLTLTTFTYDSYGNPLTSQTSTHPAITYTYDAIGRITDLYDQENQAKSTHFVYDKRGLLQSKKDMLNNMSTFTYLDNGLLWKIFDRNNTTQTPTATYTYTPTDKVNTITYFDSSAVSYHYNNLDQLIGMDDLIGTTDYVNHPFTYDDAGRLTYTRDSNGNTVGYAYDALGNLTELTYPDGKKVIYEYDALNRIKTVKINWLNQTATYDDYDAAGRLPGFTNFNGARTTYGYDNANRLKSISNQGSGGVIAGYNFVELDGNGNRTNVVQNEPYAPAMGEGNVTYEYNDNRNRLTTINDTANYYTYDNEGQLKTGNNNTVSYTFDYEHRLKTISNPATTFYYDGAGNRLKVDRAGVVTKYIYDAAGRLLAEADSNNTITKYYIYGLGLLAEVTPTNNVYCYHFNGVGSTVAITDSAQAVVNKYSYDVFGNIAAQQETISQPFKYVGQHGVMTEPNGFYYMKARYYDPTVGRFISEDPSGFGGGDVNLLAYVGNNPVTGIDPSGLEAQTSTNGYQNAQYLVDNYNIPYKKKGTNLSGMDCSYFVQYSMGDTGARIWNTSMPIPSSWNMKEIYPATSSITAFKSDVNEGDLFVWSGIHTAWYAGGNSLLHAHGSAGDIAGYTSDLSTYWLPRKGFPDVYRQQ